MRKVRDRPEKNFHFHFKNRLLLNERGEDTPTNSERSRNHEKQRLAPKGRITPKPVTDSIL